MEDNNINLEEEKKHIINKVRDKAYLMVLLAFIPFTLFDIVLKHCQDFILYRTTLMLIGYWYISMLIKTAQWFIILRKLKKGFPTEIKMSDNLKSKIMTKNEMRAVIGLPPIEEGDNVDNK